MIDLINYLLPVILVNLKFWQVLIDIYPRVIQKKKKCFNFLLSWLKVVSRTLEHRGKNSKNSVKDLNTFGGDLESEIVKEPEISK